PSPKKSASPSPYWEFTSKEGYPILVGKNATSNDQLTLKVAKSYHYFFHVQHHAGSHVVVVCPKNLPTLPPETIRDAATLALHYSKLRKTGRGEVNYTLRKYVHKPKKAPPGKVLLYHNKSIYLTLEPQRLERLQKSKKTDKIHFFSK
ncbi:MAG: DUF814 domain-containing protein, partial [Planctomycetota bacterium]